MGVKNLQKKLNLLEADIASHQVTFFSVVRQKGESQNGCLKKTKHSKFSEKRKNVRVRIRGYEMFVFSENLVCFVFLKHPFRDSPICLITNVICLLSLTHVRPMFNRLKFGIK